MGCFVFCFLELGRGWWILKILQLYASSYSIRIFDYCVYCVEGLRYATRESLREGERNVNCMGNPCEVSGTSHKTEWLYSNPNPSKREKQGGTLPISIETDESREQENREVSLLLQQRTPIPRRGQTSIDGRVRFPELLLRCELHQRDYIW